MTLIKLEWGQNLGNLLGLTATGTVIDAQTVDERKNKKIKEMIYNVVPPNLDTYKVNGAISITPHVCL